MQQTHGRVEVLGRNQELQNRVLEMEAANAALRQNSVIAQQ